MPPPPTKRSRSSGGKKCSRISRRDTPPIVRRNAELLCVLSKASADDARRLIQNAPADFLKCISLLAFNILNGHMPVTPKQTSLLTPYAKKFRSFARRTLSAKKRRASLLSGGFLPALLGVLGSVLAPKLLKGLLGR